MQQYITKELLDDFGIAIPNDVELMALLNHLNDELAMRIGRELAEELDDDKFDEMAEIQESGDQAKLEDWLRKNVSDLQEIAEDERDILLGEIADNAETLNAIARGEHPLKTA